MSYPKLYSVDEDSFTSQGKGVLSDVLSCVITEELNDTYELVMQYPIAGIHADEIYDRTIVAAKTAYDGVQAFRVYEVTEDLNGIMTVYARHISYDLSGFPVKQFSAINVNDALSGLISNCLLADKCRFTLTTSKTTKGNFTVDFPSSIRSWMSGKEGSIIDRFKGEWHFDNFNCVLESKRGANRGVSIRYGKNLVGFNKEERASNYSHALAYYYGYDANGVYTFVSGSPMNVNAGINGFTPNTLIIDATEHFGEKAPGHVALDQYAVDYVNDRELTERSRTYTIEWVQLEDIKEEVRLGDTVTAYYNSTTYTARVVKTVWDVVQDRYKSIDIGNPKATKYGTAQKIAIERNASVHAIERITKPIVDTAVQKASGNFILNTLNPSLNELPCIAGDTTNGGFYYSSDIPLIFNDGKIKIIEDGNVKLTYDGVDYQWAPLEYLDFGTAGGSGGTFHIPRLRYEWYCQGWPGQGEATNYMPAVITTLQYGTYTFSADISTDWFKNAICDSTHEEGDSDIALYISPRVRLGFVHAFAVANSGGTYIRHTIRRGIDKAWNGENELWGAPNDELPVTINDCSILNISYANRQSITNGKVFITFDFDPYKLSEWTKEIGNTDIGSFTLPNYAIIDIGFIASGKGIVKSGNQDMTFEVSHMMLNQGSSAVDWTPAEDDLMTAIPDSKIDELFGG